MKQRLFRTIFVTIMAASFAPLALAQPVSDARAGQSWIGLVVAIVLAIAVAIVSFLSPKRGHQD